MKGGISMKKMKCAKVIAALLAVSAIALTGCGKGESNTGSGTEDTSEWYDVSREDMEEAETTTTAEVTTTEPETTTSTDSTESTEDSSEADNSSSEGDSSSGSDKSSGGGSQDKTEPVKEKVYYPDVEIYGDKNALKYAELTEIKINDVAYNIRKEDLDEIVKGAGLEQTSTVFKNDDEGKTDGILWYGNGYRVQGNEEEGFLYMEVLDYDQINVGTPDVNKAGIHLRGIYVNNDTTKGGVNVSVSGVSCGMPRSDVEKCLGGKGNTSKNYTYYANKLGAIMLHYDSSDNVDEIYVFVDYDYLKIKYIK